ncbi:sodium:calcium antiporter [Jannaschia donghaensis]|uniref:Inner membrane protein YrbG n=1 Tax=Jannaschia donghaensis TaxID=420998 RepID=A0A0M6YK90_9RHOB|nr:sodium:calcium antiporter [Jannaschia donghaensis]CTQ50360.1 Inner membrane protein YrbG [Jannaschia donghaensis]
MIPSPGIWPLAMLWLGFAVAAGGIWVAGGALARAADRIADRYSLAKSLVGLLFLSVVTSLPEIVTTFAGAVRNQPDLVLGNLFGGVALQTTILAVADLWARGAITRYPRRANHVLECAILIGLLSLVLIAILSGEPAQVGWVGIGALVAGLAYGAGIARLRRYDRAGDWVPVDLPDVPSRDRQIREDLRPRRLFATVAVCAVVILVLGLMLMAIAPPLAARLGIGTGLLGVTLLAAVTSLPELTTTIAAVRLGAHGLAISNVFGSNLIMMGLLLPADILYRPAPILRDAEAIAPLSIVFGILVTLIYLIGLTARRKPQIGRLGIDSVAVVACYVLSLAVYFAAR